MAAVAAILLVLVTPTAPAAHEVPADILVQAFVKPEGRYLRLIVRVPMEAMRDLRIPERGAGYLDIPNADPVLRDAAFLWIADNIQLFENGTALENERVVVVRIALPSDRSFSSYESALAHVNSPRLPDDTEIPWQQALLDIVFEYPITSDQSDFSIDPSLALLGMRTTTVLRFVTPEGIDRAYQYAGNPGLVRLDPRWHQAALRFVSLGFFHILDGIDHLLFLLCLVIPVRRFRQLVPIVTSFTVAHSITLIASAFGLAPRALWFPPLIETLIALSIVYMAFENIVGANLQRRWLIAFAFGLVHGFGFSFALAETLQFAGSHLLTSLLSFNVGVELGQILVVMLAIPALEWMFRSVVAERMGSILLSALVAHSAWHWTSARAADLRQYRFQWPALDVVFWVAAMRWTMLMLILAGSIWLLFGVYQRFGESQPMPEASVAADD